IAVDGLHIAAERHVQETMDLALGMVEAAGARPAIGAAEHRMRAVPVSNADEFRAEQVECPVPRQWHELVAPAAFIGSGSLVEPSAADHRLRDTCPMMQRHGEILDDTIGIGIIRMRTDFKPSLRPACREYTPMGGMRTERRFGFRAG